jgi:hypothetical protein
MKKFDFMKIWLRIRITVSLVLVSVFANGQQVIGTFPNMNGGFEGTTGSITSTTQGNSSWWLQQTSNNTITITTGGSGARTGSNFLNAVQTGTAARRIHSPISESAMIGGTIYTVQFYYKGDKDGTPHTTQTMSAGMYNTFSTPETKFQGWLNPNQLAWTKNVFTIGTAFTNTAEIYGIVRLNNGCTFDFDDFVVYAGTEDNTAPDVSTDFVANTASTQIEVSWTAPAGGVDGGGYLVVRHTVDPTTAPNVNGIYAVGNSIGDGTVVYIGTGTTFTDTDLSTTTQYYYRVYTVDKAFNYSTALTGNATTTSASYASEPTAQVTGLNFTSVSSTEMTINWTPAVSGGGTNHLVVIGTSLSGDPADGSSYTANTDYTSESSSTVAGGKVVYNGTGNSVTVTGLTYNTTYSVRVYDFNGSAGTENYYTTSPASGSQLTDRRTITSAASGAWATAGTWSPAAVPTQNDNVVIANGHVVTFTGISANACYNLDISSGAQLHNITGTPTYSIGYMGIYGPSVIVNGTFGDAVTEYVTGIQYNQNCTLSGSGTVKINRIRPYANATNISFTFDADANITNSSPAMMFDNSGNSNIGYVINSGKTVTVAGQMIPSATSTLTINGTLSMLTGSNADFTTNYCTGTGTFNLNSGSTLKFGAADGLSPTTGSIRCTTRNFDTAANYQFTGSVAQVPGSDFPATVNNLTLNNAAGVTFNSSVTVNGALALTAGTLDFGANTLLLKGNITGTGSTSGTGGTITIDGSSIQTNAATLAASTINLNAGKRLTNDGTISATDFTIASSSSGTGSFKNSGTLTVTGTSKVQQYLTNQSWYLTSPVWDGVSVSNPVTPTNLSRIQGYNEGVGTGNDWSVSGTTMIPYKGYITTVSDNPKTVEFTGKINSGDFSIPLTRQGVGNENKYGFNLIGNPYTAYLDWKAVATANASKMPTSTMWYRTKASGSWAFSTVNGSGVVSPANVSDLIPPMQAFWVRASTVGSSTLDLTTAMLAHDNTSSNKMKAPATTSPLRQLVRLQVSNAINTDELVVYTDPLASNSIDSYDSPKMSNENADIPEISTVVGSEYLVINGLNSLPLDELILVRFVTKTANAFTIKANEITNLPENVKVILKDQSAEFDLTDGTEYNFSSGIADDTSRFALIFRTPGVTTALQSENADQIRIYVNENNKLVITSPESLPYVIFTIAGQRVQEGVSNSDIRLNKGIYVVKVNKTVSKIIVN